MGKRASTPEPTRQAALKMLGSGKVTLPEMAGLIGASTHMVWNWCREAGLDWKERRERYLANEWRKLEP